MKTIYTNTKKALGTLAWVAVLLTGLFTDALAQTWTIGTGTGSSTTTGYPCVWGNYYWGARQQFIYHASELTAAGMTAGTISQIGWETTALNNNLQPNFTISLKNSATNALTAWETGMTLVYGPVNFTAGAAGWKDFTLGAFSWDGTSNIIVEVCTQGTSFTNNPPVRQTTLLPANTSRVYRADASGVCSSGLVTTVTTTTRPNARFIRLSSCSGTPDAGTATGPSSACSGVNFTLSASGLSTGSGISYNWQRSTDGGVTWVNIPGATSSTAIVNQTAATQYRIYTLCSISGLSNVSNVVSVAIAPFWACYCAATSPYGGATSTLDEDIGNVTLVGQTVTLNNTTTCASPASTAPGTPSLINQYQNYTDLSSVPDLGQAANYNISLTSITCGGNYGNGFKVWIDFDQSGTFEGSEVVYNSSTSISGPHTESGIITIPGTASLGITGMLVKNIETTTWPNTNTACLSFTWGEAELYRVNIIATPPCSGTPASGTASATPAGLVCPSTNIALSATGLTSAPGISYQWQANNATLGGWTNLPAGGITVVSGSVTSSAVTVTNQTENTQYRIFTNCTFGSSNVSNTVTKNNDVPTNCYCVPSYTTGNTSGDYIDGVELNTLSNLNTGANATPYTIYPTTPSNLTTSLDIGSGYTITIYGTVSWTQMMGAWIDYNQNGNFEASEKLGEVSVAPLTSGNISFTVPPTATPGATRLRVRAVYGGSSILPCATYTLGEVEDYTITLVTLPNCTGMPVGGTTTTTPSPGCVGIPFTLSVTGATTGFGGFDYQWQTATAPGGPWTDITGGVGLTQSFTYAISDPNYYFRRRMICTYTNDTAYSSALLVNKTICYCNTSFTSGNGAGFFISRVRVEGGLLDNTSSGAGAAPAYQDFTGTTSGTGTGSRGAYYWLRINSGTNAGIHYYGAWADWNQDGDFVDAGENLCSPQYTQAPGGAGAGGVVNILFQVPAGATLGTTRLRVRAYNTNPFTFLDPCTNYTIGETEDYDFVVTAATCPPAGSVAGNLTGITPTFTVNNDVVSPNITGGTGTLIRWEVSYDNFTTVAGNFIAYPTPAPFVFLNVNPQPFVYVRAVYQNEGCPSTNSNVAFVKVDCATNITIGAHDNDNITNVRLRTLPGLTTLIDNNSTVDPVDPDSYQNFKTISADIERGKQYELRITPQGSWSEHCAAWIDFNGDGTFQNNEMVARSATTSSAAQTFTFTVPCSPTNPNANFVGTVVMRVMTKFSGSPIDSNACWNGGSYGYGEIEEYSVNILPLPNLTVTPPNAVCVPAGGTITVSGGTGSYTWAPASGLSATTGSSVTLLTIPTLQFYTVTGTQPGTGCALNQTFAAATLPIGGNAIPATSVVCSGGSKVFTASGSAGNLQWQTAPSPTGPWTNVTGATNTTYNMTGITGTTYVRVLVSSAACFDIASTTAVVHVSSTPVVSITNVTSTTAVITWSPYGSGQYNIAWTGAGTGSVSGVTTNNYALSGLTPNTNLNVTVTLATPTCTGTSPGTATTKTLCAKPTITSLISVGGAPNPVGIRVNWTSVPGAPGYRIYFRNLSNNSNWQFVDTVGGTTKTIMQSVSGLIAAGADMAVYVAVNGCPANPITLGEGSNVSYVTIPPTSSCLNVPTFTATSNCPNQITVSSLAGSGTGTYDLQFRRIFPTVTSGVVYTTTSTTFNLTIGSQFAGSVWEVYARANCGSTRGNWSAPVIVEVKPGCAAINNPVISKITCYGATVSWNADDCNGIGVSGYYLYIKKSTATSYSAYPVGNTVWKVVNWLAPNTTYDVFVRSVACNGSLSANSVVLQFTTGGPGCREEEAENVEAVNGNGEVVNIFPNPTSGNFSVSVNSNDMSAQEVRIEVMNALGQVLVTNVTNMTGGNIIEGIQLDNSVSSGVYFVRVHVGNNVYVNRLVLSRD